MRPAIRSGDGSDGRPSTTRARPSAGEVAGPWRAAGAPARAVAGAAAVVLSLVVLSAGIARAQSPVVTWPGDSRIPEAASRFPPLSAGLPGPGWSTAGIGLFPGAAAAPSGRRWPVAGIFSGTAAKRPGPGWSIAGIGPSPGADEANGFTARPARAVADLQAPGSAPRARDVLVRLPNPTWSAGGIRPLPNPQETGAADPARGQITLNVSRGQTLRLARPAASVFIADPTIADIQTPSDQVVFVFGKKPGRTSLFALDEAGRAIAEYGITVTQPIEDLRNLLQSEIGDYKVSVAYTPNGAVLSGTLPNAGLVESAKTLTQSYIGPGATVTNRLRVSGALQVNLQVRVAEVNRRVLKQFGVNLAAGVQAGGFGFALGTTGGAGARTDSFVQNGNTFAGRVGFSYSDGLNTLSATIDALAQDGLVTILAEPNLTAVSGERASFLAGGEFPIPIAQALGQTSVQFRRFGASLEFQPTVLSGNLINVRVRPEVSELSDNGAVELNGFRIPALTTRSADTVVELASGQSFAIGGLIRKNFSTNVGVLPGLGDLPILGALFRSSAFQKEESELVIIVTPYIVRPSASPQALQAPTDRVAPPTDAGRILLNTLSKAPSGRLAPRTGSVGITGEAGLGVE